MRFIFSSLVLLLLTGLFSPWATAQISGTPLKTPDSSGNGFTRISSADSGVAFANPIDTNHELKRLYVTSFSCGSVALGDFNGDGKTDVFFTNGPRPNGLYLQTKPWRFAESGAVAGVAEPRHWSAGAAPVDIDGDGDLDLYICHYDQPNTLYINQGNNGEGVPVFKEQAKAAGLAVTDASLMPSFCDYDRDGDLDLFLQCSEYKHAGGRPSESEATFRRNNQYFVKPEWDKYYAIRTNEYGKPAFVNAARANYLFRNDTKAGQPLTFTDATETAGIHGRHFSNSATWWDYNNDGWMDLYVGNDFRDPDQLYHNNGDGTFREVIRFVTPHTTWFSMGADVADINNDGHFDFLIADMAGSTHYASKATMGEMGKFRRFLQTAIPRQHMHNALYLNTGVRQFQEISYLTGLAKSDWTWAIKFGDFDNDTLSDVYITNGVARSFNDSDNAMSSKEAYRITAWDHWEKFPPRKEQNFAFRNKGDLAFENQSKKWGLDHIGMSYASATGDIDGDGDLDIVTANLDEEVHLYRNDLPAKNANRVTIALRSPSGNSRGIGARIIAECDGGKVKLSRQLIPATGFVSSNQNIAHFGLGPHTKIDNLRVEWPGGAFQEFRDVAANQHYTITESKANAVDPPEEISKTNPGKPRHFILQSPPATKTAQHRESFFDDYERQPLLPYKHSRLGPGIARADVDRDGDEDCYVGMPAGKPGTLMLNDGKGAPIPRFDPSPQTAFEQSAAHEDMGALFFDADGDFDADLYVVSGSVEWDAESPLYQDRLYLNDGKGAFTRAPEGSLPAETASGSSVVAADFDKDGDLDLFVGGRVKPGSYPLSSPSLLLENRSTKNKTHFVNIATPELTNAGLVTSALWSDADGDGWLDLLVATEWGNVRLFSNQDGGGFKELTKAAGLTQHLGWWNGIAGGDIDHDGDIDYVATNFGLNTQYKASIEKPELLYYGDMDGTGVNRIIEAKFEGKTCYPRRGLSCSSHAMPSIRSRLKTFHNFASSTLQEIYTPTRLESAQRFKANTLEHVVFRNQGDGTFKKEPLPRYAQAAPAFGVAVSDLNGDGHPDIVMAQNFYGPQPETGRMDGGLGCLLYGDGKGNWTPVWPEESGIALQGDGKGLTISDLDKNGRPDITFTFNNGPAVDLTNSIGRGGIAIRLSGPAGNPTAVGARVVLTPSEGPVQTAEIYAGNGYLSQSTPALFFGGTGPFAVSVTWPDGRKSEPKVNSVTTITLHPPGK